MFFGRRKGRDVPVNENVALVPVFAPDPHGAAMFSILANATVGHLGSRPVLGEGPKWHGWTQNPQAPMRGAGNLNGTGRPVVSPVTTLDRASTYAPDNIQAIFAQRATERSL